MKKNFLTPFIGELLADGTWRVHEPFVFAMGHEDSTWRIEVEKGFETDFASVPKCLHWLLGAIEDYGKAAVIHDKLYKTQPCSRVVADAVFMEAMMDLGVAGWKRWTMYLALRMFGRVVWNEHRARLIAEGKIVEKERA